MEFFKKNYEKIVLAVVLLGLTVAACLLPFIISDKRSKLETQITRPPHPKELLPLDMSVEDTTMQRAKAAYALDFTTKHNLFNPVTWKKKPDGTLLKEQTGNEEGAGALELTATKPLFLKIVYGSPSANGYMITIDRPAAPPGKQQHMQSFVSKENDSELVKLHEVKGPADKPTELDLEWKETGETIALVPDKPYQKVEAYMADLKYPLEANKVWTDRHVNQTLMFANAKYKIVAITQSNVVVSAPNDKKTTITLHSAN
jgi:hypothetical protein